VPVPERLASDTLRRMANRREFMRTVAAGAAGLCATTHGAAAWQGPAQRRQVTIDGRRIRVIDGHAHCVIDTMVFSDEGLRHRVAEAGVGQVVYGTDVPFNWPVTVDLVLNAKHLSDSEKEAILSTNLMKLLRIS
jgi:hypothetical protein